MAARTPDGAVFRVEGAGSGEVNGFYRENGEQYNKKEYIQMVRWCTSNDFFPNAMLLFAHMSPSAV